MRIVGKILKGFAKLIGILLVVIILAGLAFRIFGPERHEPLGEIIDTGEFKLHLNRTGTLTSEPTVVIEGGNGMATEYYHWLSEGLKDSMHVVRYDRAGLGYSEASNTPRDPETIARELHTLLEKAGETPPYIMVGHSLGGPYVRVFTELYPDEVAGMVLLDVTHPERVERITTIPKASSWTFKAMIGLYDVQGVLANLGIMMLYDRLAGPIMHREMEGLPDEINHRSIDFLSNGKHVRTMGDEMAHYHSLLKRAGEQTDFGALPVRIFPAAIREIPEDTYQRYLKNGTDIRKNQLISRELQEDYLNLSTNSKLIEVNGDHNTLFTKKENAEVICQEILALSRQLDQESKKTNSAARN